MPPSWCMPRSLRCRKRAPVNADRLWRMRSSPTVRRFPRPLARSWSCWLESTCSDLLDLCLRGQPWPSELLDRAIAEDDGRALFSIVVERLGDLFEPHLCDVYN